MSRTLSLFDRLLDEPGERKDAPPVEAPREAKPQSEETPDSESNPAQQSKPVDDAKNEHRAAPAERPRLKQPPKPTEGTSAASAVADPPVAPARPASRERAGAAEP